MYTTFSLQAKQENNFVKDQMRPEIKGIFINNNPLLRQMTVYSCNKCMFYKPNNVNVSSWLTSHKQSLHYKLGRYCVYHTICYYVAIGIIPKILQQYR